MANVITLFIILLLLIISGCSNNNQDKIYANKSQKNFYENNIQSANIFWKQFRKAVLVNDKEAITSMSQLPLIVDFEEEGAPNHYEYNSFPELIDMLLQIKGDASVTEYELINQTKNITQNQFTDKGNSFSVGFLNFVKIKNRWFLNSASFFDYKDIFVTGPKGTPQQSIQDFWDNFRKAIIDDDIDSIISTVSLPFKTNQSDLDPVDTYNDVKSLRDELRKLLNGNVGTKNKPESMRDFAKRTTILTNKNSRCVGNDFCEIGNFCFLKMMGKWYFISSSRGE